MAVCRRLSVLGFAQSQADSDGTRAAVKLNFQDIGDVIRSETSTFSSVCLNKQRQGLATPMA